MQIETRLWAMSVRPTISRVGYGMPYPRVIPHSDGAGVIDAVGDGLDADRIGERVWVYGAQSYRPTVQPRN
jgi:NADPH:quinone reductase-like Zn-dependent oxidoreductase